MHKSSVAIILAGVFIAEQVPDSSSIFLACIFTVLAFVLHD